MKKFIALILALLMVLSLAACAAGGKGGLLGDCAPSEAPFAFPPDHPRVSSNAWARREAAAVTRLSYYGCRRRCVPNASVAKK